jgi:hypothetical protein
MATDRRAGRFALALLAALIAGCERDLPPGNSRKTVSLSEVPEPVMAKAKASLPGIKFEEAWKNIDREGKLHSFEVRGKAANGKIREVRVSPVGEILEME